MISAGYTASDRYIGTRRIARELVTHPESEWRSILEEALGLAPGFAAERERIAAETAAAWAEIQKRESARIDAIRQSVHKP